MESDFVTFLTVIVRFLLLYEGQQRAAIPPVFINKSPQLGLEPAIPDLTAQLGHCSSIGQATDVALHPSPHYKFPIHSQLK